MASKYWIKLYHEILDDPKMGRLTDRLWRRTVELFLIAGDKNGDDKSGELPSTYDMAWRLRMKEDELETDLADLASFGIVNKENDRWIVTNFEKRQQPMPKDEYMRRLRQDRKRDVFVTPELPNSYQAVTSSNAEVEEDIETDIEVEEDIDKEVPPEQFDQLMTAFIDESEIPAFGINKKDVEAGQRMVKAGITSDEVVGAVKVLQDKGYTMSGLASVEKTAYNQRSKRKGKARSDRSGEKERKKYADEWQ